MVVLVLGSGAREHALVRSLTLDPSVDRVVALPGNPGIADLAGCLPGDPADPTAVVHAARSEGADLVVVGPEAPLVAGVADALRESGIPCFGPSAQAAALEGSKAFAKEVMAAAGVPTAAAHVCTTVDEVERALDATGSPYVVKEDGLAAGKGVVVTTDRARAREHATACLERADAVVVEDFLNGPEVSLFCLSDGRTVVALEPAQDFKRVGAGDTGPNTGGMGAYSPLTWAPTDLVPQVLDTVARPTVAEMARRGTPFVGVLYVGLALTADGPRVVEFNARFGDPETQVVLARLRTPLGVVLRSAAEGELSGLPELEWSPRTSVNVVVAAEHYPGTPATGDTIGGIEHAEQVEDVHVLHAGTRRETSTGDQPGGLVSSGGRVLSVVSLADDLPGARSRAYEAAGRITLRGSHTRPDIGLAAERGEVVVPGQEA
ncbi:phosphoribosylamine--glycine ligase [Serinicoccus marinus]|uniref:phosphoribosylamine--glycine ligase n=1 Tax=Serinicoccus marinus TaxID=247333 RepID=UPI00249070DE|nr:phosphoribosylamine--glycine ligase [Serinicoccus marinus]